MPAPAAIYHFAQLGRIVGTGLLRLWRRASPFVKGLVAGIVTATVTPKMFELLMFFIKARTSQMFFAPQSEATEQQSFAGWLIHNGMNPETWDEEKAKEVVINYVDGHRVSWTQEQLMFFAGRAGA